MQFNPTDLCRLLSLFSLAIQSFQKPAVKGKAELAASWLFKAC